jgi:hypothetical protein
MTTKFEIIQWTLIKDKLRDKYPELTHADFFMGRLSGDDLLDMISSKLGLTQRELLDTIESL